MQPALFLLLLAASPGASAVGEADANALAANRALVAAHRYLEGWLRYQDPGTGLVPQRTDDTAWTPENAAADHYAFMVLTSFYTDPARLSGTMREILDAEMMLSTRVRSLPDTVHVATGAFVHPAADNARIVFGASEYCKDGLLPIAEVMGRSPWFERLRDMAADLIAESKVESDYGLLPAQTAEVNGELLQVYSRLAQATGDHGFLDAAFRIADAYFLGVLPRNGGLPCHVWDFAEHRPLNPALHLGDHGSEIIGGLSEAFVAASRYDPQRAAAYEPPFRRMLDTLLERARNQRGILSMAPEGDGGVPDTWGYVYNAYYTAYLLLGEERYREATLQALDAITGYLEWGGADAYADCEESAIVLLNRECRPPTLDWLERMLERHYAYQQPDGTIEGWYGDGNSARTWLMYAMMRTAGTRVEPWREDVRFGAAMDRGGLVVTATAARPWRGKLYFDGPRHGGNMGLALNYPRLNEWPEWWPVEPGSVYEIRTPEGARTVPGYRLLEGIDLRLAPGVRWTARVRRVSEHPHADAPIELTAPSFVNLAAQSTVPVVVRNRTSASLVVRLDTSIGRLSVIRAGLRPCGERELTLTCAGPAAGEAVIRAEPVGRLGSASVRVCLFDDETLLDWTPLSGSSVYAGRPYRWLGDRDIAWECRLGGATEIVVSLLWGAKGDTRGAVLRIGGVERRIEHGGYDGFEWLQVPVSLGAEADRALLELLPTGSGQQAFVAEIAVRRGT